MENDLNKILINSININKNNLLDNIEEIINKIKMSLSINKDLIIKANQIDLQNKNGFELSFDIVEKLFENINNETIKFGEVIKSTRNNNLFYGKQIYDYGTVIIVTEGNTYAILEMILKNILAGNNVIFNDSGYMQGTNGLIFELVDTVLEQYNLKNMIQRFISRSPEEILKRNSNIDLVICIGDSNLQNKVLQYNKNEIKLSGYLNYDIYIEDNIDEKLLSKINDLNLSINYYINENININLPKQAIQVKDIEEAVGQINYQSNKYSAAIFTNNKNNASKFIKEVKANCITVNTSPTIEQMLDINTMDLVRIKTIIYPN